jgi:hypothetical protein
MAVDPNISKLQKAGIPPFTYTTTLPQEGFQALRDIVSQKAYVKDTGLVSYLLEPAQSGFCVGGKPTKAAALFGKELALTGNPVTFTTLAGFLREVRLQDYTADERAILNPLLDRIGKGFLIITEFDDMNSQPSTSVFRDGLDILIRHLSLGGGLVLACNDRWKGSMSEFTPTFVACVNSFTRMPT